MIFVWRCRLDSLSFHLASSVHCPPTCRGIDVIINLGVLQLQIDIAHFFGRLIRQFRLAIYRQLRVLIRS